MTELIDVQGAFLNGRFQNGEKLYIHVPQGFKKYYPPIMFLLLLRTIYGFKQTAMQYWRELLKVMRFMKLGRN